MKRKSAYISDVMNQKTLVKQLSLLTGISKNKLVLFIRNARNQKYVWDDFDYSELTITVFMDPGKMFYAITLRNEEQSAKPLA